MSVTVTKTDDKVVVTFIGSPNEEVYTNQYMCKLDAVFKLKQRFRILYDTRKIGKIDFPTILRQAKYMQSRKTETSKYMSCFAILIKDNTTRFCLNMLFKLKKPTVKNYIISKDINEVKLFMQKNAGSRTP